MLNIVQSNSFEVLCGHLLRHADQYREADPLAPERIVIPSLGLARELTQRIAIHRGVCANLGFDFPAQFVWRLFARVLPEIPQHSPFDGDVMTLRLFTLLRNLPGDADHAALNAWLGQHGAGGRIDLAGRISGLFQQYLAYRPDWLERWGQGGHLGLGTGPAERWQQALWQRMLEVEPVAGPRHPRNAVFSELDRRLRDGRGVAEVLPAQIRVIGVPSLPPLYLDVLQRLAQYTEVTVWFLNPCRAFWADLQSPRVMAWRAARDGSAMPEIEHSLLASWGRQARDQFARFVALDGVAGVDDIRVFVDRGGNSLLARLQQSLLDLQALPRFVPDAQDRSVRFNRCHSLTRQLQALHDALLAAFAADPSLQPDDVLVLLPDLDRAAADIDAVFGGMPQERRIPFAISGLRVGTEGPYWTAWGGLLELLDSRFTAAGLLDWLRQPPVAGRFGLDETDFDTLARWVTDTGIRWGRDATQRTALGLPDQDDRHSWAYGIRQLLAGFAAPVGGHALLAGVLPYDDIEGSQALVLGRLLQALGVLDAAARAAGGQQPIGAWCVTLGGLAERCLAPEPAQRGDAERLRRALAAIAADAAHTGSDEAVPLAVMQRLLDGQLQRGGPGGVPTGRVSFTAFGPLRGLPFRIVCALDLNSDDFPRNPPPLEFDLMAQLPRAGDRSRRDEDRGAFLDAVLAAQDRLWLSWNGLDARDNQPLPPSVVVAELIDTLAAGAQGGRHALMDAHARTHPLQPFSPELFDAQAPRSYAREFLAAAEAVRRPPSARAPRHRLLDMPLPPAGDEWRQLTLEQLARFFRNPARALLRDRLGIELTTPEDALADSEPFLMERDGQRRLRQRLLQRALDGGDPEHTLRLAAAAPELPQGPLGRSLLAGEQRALQPLVDALREQQRLPPLPFDLRLDTASGPFRLSGTLAPLTTDGLLIHDVTDFGLYPLIDAWPRHLVLNLLRPTGVNPQTRLLLGGDTEHPLPPRNDAEHWLCALLEAYWRGLHAPLPFGVKAANAYLKAGNADSAQSAARSAWVGGDYASGDGQNRWCILAYGGPSTLPEGFADTAEALFAPLREVLAV